MSRGRLFVTLAALFVATAAHGDEPVKLGKEEAQKALAGKTVSYRNVNGSGGALFFDTDGRVTYRVTGGTARPSAGTWEIQDNGRYCVKFTSGTATDHCRSIWKTDSGFALGSTTGELIPASVN